MDLIQIVRDNKDNIQYKIRVDYIVQNKQYISNKFQTDGCTGISDTIFGFDFSKACIAHDGFYRDKFDGTRKQADLIFYSLMLIEARKQAKNPYHHFLGQCVALWRYMGVRCFGWFVWRPNGKNSYFEKIKCSIF